MAADVRGVFTYLFVDAGPSFEVVDSTGEELKEVYISSVTKAEHGIVTTHDNRLHELEDGDRVVFKEVLGMTELNSGVYTVKVRVLPIVSRLWWMRWPLRRSGKDCREQ